MRRRSSLRLPHHDYGQPGAYFLTVCTEGKECLLGAIIDDAVRLSEIGEIVESCWWRIPRHLRSVELGAFVVMPNHVHGIVLLTDRATRVSPLRVVVGAFKACGSRNAGRRLWQRGYFERVIRDENELELIQQYIADNPVKWAIDGENPANLV